MDSSDSEFFPLSSFANYIFLECFIVEDGLLCVGEGVVWGACVGVPGDTMVTGPEEDPSTNVVPVTGPRMTVPRTSSGFGGNRLTGDSP